MSVERDSMAAYYDEASASMVELDEDVAKVVEQLDHGRSRGTNRTGSLSPECRA